MRNFENLMSQGKLVLNACNNNDNSASGDYAGQWFLNPLQNKVWAAKRTMVKSRGKLAPNTCNNNNSGELVVFESSARTTELSLCCHLPKIITK